MPELCRAHAPKGQPAKARGGTPGTTPHHALCALKGHTEPGACHPRSPRWVEVSCGNFSRRGRETRHRRLLLGLAAWRLCLSCLSLKGTKGKSREASKPQREERRRTNRKLPQCKTLSDPDPPFQGFVIIPTRVPGAMPRAIVGRPVGAHSCPEGATGERPGWNPGNHATPRPPCPERAHGTGCL